jgi:hypothetical protein
MSRGKLKYLKGIRGNPFNRGIINNILFAIRVPEMGQYFIVNTVSGKSIHQKWKFITQLGTSKSSAINIMSAAELMFNVTNTQFLNL